MVSTKVRGNLEVELVFCYERTHTASRIILPAATATTTAKFSTTIYASGTHQLAPAFLYPAIHRMERRQRGQPSKHR
jgi:hypothetical protein